MSVRETANLREIEVFERFNPDGPPVWKGLASSPIHAMDLYAIEQGFGPYSALTEEGLLSVYVHDGKLWAPFTNTEIFVHLGTPEDVAGAMIVRRLVERGKREILEDVMSGKVPKFVTSFGDLHDYVDANEYAGLCEDGIFEITDDHYVTANLIQDKLHEWIASGEMRRMIESVPMNEKIKRAARDAENQFWAEIVRHFPEVTTGDLDPLTTHNFEQSCKEVVKAWLRSNHPVLAVIDPVL